ncbi:MAG: BatD family protein, partial [Bacteroidota bacterium]
VSKQNLAELNFYQLGEQIADIRKQITPANVWEENFEIENISNQSVTINGEGYKQYKLYQATFYPNNTQSIAFPKVALKMIKYKIAKNPSFFGPRRQEDFITFTTKPINIKVKELPAHPLQASAAVGNYRLKEAVSNDRLTTGNSFTYTFTVQGEGNINYIAEPQLRNTDNFDFYDPTVARTINHRDNRVTGQKSFSYYAIPNEPGSYDIGKYFSWVFFNPHSEQYDTLIASTVLQVEGESRKNMQVDAQDAGPFYNKITSIDNTLKSRNNDGWLQLAANLIILGMLILTVVVVLKK